MTTVACVLRSGGDFRPEHVTRLVDQIRDHCPTAARVQTVCLSDMDVIGLVNMPLRLKHGWPGWFSKLEVFRIPGPAIYFDLDTSIIGDLAPLLDVAESHDFVMLRGFWGVDDPSHVNSSVMAWCGDANHLYREFASAPKAHMSIYSNARKWGDQAFIRDHYGAHIHLWQTLLPGKVASFKRGALMGEDLSDCRVLVSHGRPRPWGPDGADQWLARKRPAALG